MKGRPANDVKPANENGNEVGAAVGMSLSLSYIMFSKFYKLFTAM